MDRSQPFEIRKHARPPFTNLTQASRAAFLLAYLVTHCVCPSAHASNVIVPDDSPTIQEAIDVGPDTVLVRPGTYLEAPILHGEVTLLSLSEGDIHPSLSGLFIVPTQFTTGYLHFTVRKLNFTGTIVIDNDNIPSMINLRECVLTGGIGDYSAFPATTLIALHGCKVSNGAFLKADGDCVIDSCEFDTHLVVGQQNCRLFVNDSWFHGTDSGVGVSTIGGGSDLTSASIRNTLIEHYSTGLIMSALYSVRLDSIKVRDCINGRGLYARADAVSIGGSQIDRCGDYGISAEGIESLAVVANTVTTCRGTGILAIANYYGVVSHNVVAHNGSNGLHVAANDVSTQFDVVNNTSCLNGGSGFLSECTINFGGRYEFNRNTGVGNTEYGVTWGLPNVTSVRCNDWFGNGLGAVLGLPLANEDSFVDPMFCNPTKGDFGLLPTSPLLNLPGCGQVGAQGAGCEAPELNRFSGERTSDGILVVWELVKPWLATAVWLERSDEGADGPWIRPKTIRREDGLVVQERDQGVLPDRVYWYRIVSGEAGATEMIGQPIIVDMLPGSAFRLVSVGPSPSRGPVRIEFELSSWATIDIQVFDILGRLIASPASGTWAPGRHLVQWTGKSRDSRVTGGLFLVRYRFPGGQESRRVVCAP